MNIIGMYMDDDANIGHKLDDVIQATDKFLVGKEPYDFDDRCYTPDFPLSNHSTTLRFFNSTPAPVLFDNKFFFNWALFSSPGNPLLLRIMKHIVELLKYEYLGDSKIKLSPMDHRGKLLMCATTFPITHAAREMVFEETELEDIGLRVGGKYFEGWEILAYIVKLVGLYVFKATSYVLVVVAVVVYNIYICMYHYIVL